jgi:hypothetical protein
MKIFRRLKEGEKEIKKGGIRNILKLREPVMNGKKKGFKMRKKCEIFQEV